MSVKYFLKIQGPRQKKSETAKNGENRGYSNSSQNAATKYFAERTSCVWNVARVPRNENRRELWKIPTDPEDGEFVVNAMLNFAKNLDSLVFRGWFVN